MKYKIFEQFIEQHFEQRKIQILDDFLQYYKLLLAENEKVNLFSRKTRPEDLWTLHFLDSILPVPHLKFTGKSILDFGSGGGLPGIPLKILFPSSGIYLLDSKNKKVTALRKIIKKLDLKTCFTVVSRLENMQNKWNGKFDMIVCRSVKILPKYKEKMLKLLKKQGEIILYKSKKMDDIHQFRNKEIIDVTHPEIGTRKIIRISK